VKRSGLQPHTGETARVFALRVHESGALPAAAVETITTAYLDARYGGDESAHARLLEAVGAM